MREAFIFDRTIEQIEDSQRREEVRKAFATHLDECLDCKKARTLCPVALKLSKLLISL